jgi:uncharacterized membrane protein
MDRVIVAVFDDEKRAYEGTRALHDLHADGAITLYAETVLVKDASGKASLRAPEGEAAATFVGMLAGGLLGAIGGPAGVAIGAASGTVVGAGIDVRHAEIGADFLQEVAQHLAPRKAAVVVAEIDEEWQTPLDLRFEALGGMVFRRARIDVADAYVERELAADEAELAALKAEQAKASAERKAKLQGKVDAARRKLQDKHNQVKDRVEAVKREGDAKIASLREQVAGAKGEAKANLEQRLAEVRADYHARAAKLHQAWESMKSALAA